jgi:hypothetical protein
MWLHFLYKKAINKSDISQVKYLVNLSVMKFFCVGKTENDKLYNNQNQNFLKN